MFEDKILNSIKEITKNQEIYLVGGYLRNYFLKKEISKDRDLVCIKNAENIAKEISQKLNGTFIELDKENQIYRVVLSDKENYFDISNALEDNILKDAERRDFTINSIFYNLNKNELFDPFNGIKDIENKIIRTPNPKNLDDDSLRYLRMYRFMSYTGFKIEQNLENYSKENFKKVLSSAKERINYEILKIFEGDFLVETLLKMYENNALEVIFPFIKEIKKVPPNSHHHLDLVHHSIETVNNIQSNKPLLKIAALYHDIGKPSTWTIEPQGRHRFIGHDIKGFELAKKELSQLKFSNKQISYIAKMVKFHIYPASLINCPDNKKAYARFIRKLAEDTPDIIELSKADRLSARGVDVSDEMVEKSIKHLENLLNYYNEVQSMVKDPKSLLNGKEIMEILNIPPSKKVGLVLLELKEAQLTGEITTKKEAINFVQKQSR